MKINKIIRYGDVGMPPNEFDGNSTQFLAGMKTSRIIQAFLIPLGIWFGLADELIHRRTHTGLNRLRS